MCDSLGDYEVKGSYGTCAYMARQISVTGNIGWLGKGSEWRLG